MTEVSEGEGRKKKTRDMQREQTNRSQSHWYQWICNATKKRVSISGGAIKGGRGERICRERLVAVKKRSRITKLCMMKVARGQKKEKKGKKKKAPKFDICLTIMFGNERV